MSRVYQEGDVVQWRPNVLCGDDLVGGRVAIVHESFLTITDDDHLAVAYLVHDREDGTPGLAIPRELAFISSAVTP